MKSLEERLNALNEKHPVGMAVLYFVVVLVLLLAIVWMLLFSGLSTTADFVYNQF